MSVSVLLIVLTGALLHASWNLLVKRVRDTQLAVASVYICSALIAALILPFVPGPARASWPWLGVSIGLQLIYEILLVAVYRSGDLSYAYPLMRGTAPLIVALGSAGILGEHLSRPVWFGVGLVSVGIWSLVLAAREHVHARVTRLALLNAAMIGLYTTIDGAGVRRAGQPLAYGLWIFLLTGAPWLIWVWLRYRAQRFAAVRAQLPTTAIGGLFSIASYSIALWAMTRAPVAAVAAVRETSILFGTALGALILRERVTWVRAAAASAITLGVWAIRAG